MPLTKFDQNSENSPRKDTDMTMNFAEAYGKETANRGIASAALHVPGSTFTGTILDGDLKQRTEFGTGEKLYWDDEKTRPQMELILTLEMSNEEPKICTCNNPNWHQEYGKAPDGTRRRFRLTLGSASERAFSMALRAAGTKVPQEGGILTMTFTSYAKEKKGSFFPKLYTATYSQPTAESLKVYQAYKDESAVAAAPVHSPEELGLDFDHLLAEN